MAGLKQKFHDYEFVIAWDSKSQRRMAESTQAVEKGIIPSAYKDNRRTSADMDDQFKDMFAQMGTLKEKLNLINVNQIGSAGYEADDVIHTLCARADPADEIMVITSDKDYYQILRPNVVLYDPLNKTTHTHESFKMRYGIEPGLWVDAGALAGDKSDNIHGADGWGEVTALKYIREFGSLENILTAVSNKPEKNKKELALLTFTERLALAKSLKKMDVVQDLPPYEYKKPVLDRKELERFFLSNGFGSLFISVVRLIT